MNVHRTQSRTKALDASHVEKNLRPWLAIERQQLLFSTYPLFFRAVRYPEAYPSNLAFMGIQCGLGWYPIIEATAQEIESELYEMWCEQTIAPEGIASLDHQMRDGTHTDNVYPVIPFCTEIREASGRLRIGMANGFLCDLQAFLRIRESVENAEARALTTCERCGGPGVYGEMFWRHVCCNDCVTSPPAPHPGAIGITK